MSRSLGLGCVWKGGTFSGVAYFNPVARGICYPLMLRSTWPVVGFRPDSLWDRGQDALDSTRPVAVGGGFKPPPTRVRNISYPYSS